MAAALGAYTRAARSTSSSKSSKPRPDKGAIPEAYARSWRNAEAHRKRALPGTRGLGQVEIDLMQKGKSDLR
jgi:hypothetical protein